MRTKPVAGTYPVAGTCSTPRAAAASEQWPRILVVEPANAASWPRVHDNEAALNSLTLRASCMHAVSGDGRCYGPAQTHKLIP